MSPAIAIVGMACRYADAQTPEELWENVLSQRRSFRRMPAERLRLEDYYSADRSVPDSIYTTQASVIEGFEFDRVKFKVAGSTFRSADLSHWLALDTATKAFEDAGFEEEQLPKEMTGVFLGNTLTGEFSRANIMRLRFPFVRRVVESVLRKQKACVENIPSILVELEKTFKEPFPPIGEESLAGGLSNTIAGRICNYFDLKGGGFTVDGACSSSLLAVSNACNALFAEDVDLALAGGVDLSLDPFELVGFAKTGALAVETMRVYDARSNGFFPGEGCGFVLLMREEDAIKQGRKIYATIKGWGISSDGSGGITRPEVEGQLLAFQRAYRKAGFSADDVYYFEGHGTGTAVGDATELKTLNSARAEAEEKAVVSSIKTLIGHCKAAAGIAGLIKATMALEHEIFPPTTGCEVPHSEISKENSVLKVLRKAEVWDDKFPLRAGVSSMGFGGINTHVVLEKQREFPRQKLTYKEKTLISSAQDSELLILGENSPKKLAEKIDKLLEFAGRLSYAELSDLAVYLARNLEGRKYRAAIVVSTPAEFETRLKILRDKIDTAGFIDAENGIFYGSGNQKPRLGFLFSGQASPANIDGGLWHRRFENFREFYAKAELKQAIDTTETSIAQPAIVTATISALQLLDKFDITAQVAVGHSLGELSALHWAGVYPAETLLRVAKVRGLAMSETSETKGSMLSVSANKHQVETLLQENNQIVIAGINSPHQTVVSGEAQAIAELQHSLKNRGINSIILPVSHAFHSPLVSKSAKVLAEHIAGENFGKPKNRVISTVTGEQLTTCDDLKELLFQQITNPVRFLEAIEKAESFGVDLWIEVGTGKILKGLVEQISQVPAVAMEASSGSLKGLWETVGACFALGQEINQEMIFAGRYAKPFNLDWKPKFFINNCELAPLPSEEGFIAKKVEEVLEVAQVKETPKVEISDSVSPVELVIKLVAERAELPMSAVHQESRMLTDLHLNSITVGQIVIAAAKMLNAPPPLSPTDFADASVTEIAESLEKLREIKENGDVEEGETIPQGLDVWVRPFQTKLVETPLIMGQKSTEKGNWQIFSPDNNEFVEKIRFQSSNFNGHGVIVCLPAEAQESLIAMLLDAAKTSLQTPDSKLILLQNGRSYAGFARSFILENPKHPTCVLSLPFDDETSVKHLQDEISALENYNEVHYIDGKRFEPRAEVIDLQKDKQEIPLNEEDVLVVTGGAKGITAECVLALAKETKVKLALLGTSKSENNQEVLANLKRFQTAGIEARYYQVDVTIAVEVKEVIEKIEADLGKVTAILNAAATNEPKLVSQSDVDKFHKTISVKIDGAKNLLAAVSAQQIKLFISFGSIIARTGLQGESDYGLANEWLSDLTEKFQKENPSCKCVSFEWSVWSGIGMGTRVADLDGLIRQGIIPIPMEKGVKSFVELLKQPQMPTSFVVMSRFREVPTYRLSLPELPFWRFLEQPRVFYPNLELITDVELSTSNDLYLDDHQVEGERLFPAVLGMEAMAQVAGALLGKTERPVFEKLSFSRPIVVEENKPLKIRIIALKQENGKVEISLRSMETEFQVDHFHGVCSFENQEAVKETYRLNGHASEHVELEPEKDLYGKILFHSGRFMRLNGYKHLEAKECLAEISGDGQTKWFSQFLPKKLLLGDPARRDAAIHAIQACIPHATLLPISVEKVSVSEQPIEKPCLVHAEERSQIGNIFTYDLQVLDFDGTTFETWENLKLQMVTGTTYNDEWAEPLLAVFLERKLAELNEKQEVTVSLINNENLERSEAGEKALRLILGEHSEIVHRIDGKPETEGKHISASHTLGLTMAVVSEKEVSCDIETIEARGWLDLLGAEGFKLAEIIAQELNESFDASATRIWNAKECLKKSGASPNAPLTFSNTKTAGWIVFKSGEFLINSYLTKVQNCEKATAVGILVKNNE